MDVKLNKKQATTNDQGIATCQFENGGTLMVTATKGNDVTFNPHLYCDDITTNNYSWFVFDDRNLYQPGESVHIKGYLRQLVTENSIRYEIPTTVTENSLKFHLEHLNLLLEQ